MGYKIMYAALRSVNTDQLVNNTDDALSMRVRKVLWDAPALPSATSSARFTECPWYCIRIRWDKTMNVSLIAISS